MTCQRHGAEEPQGREVPSRSVTPLVAGAPEDAVRLFVQHPLQELLHALPGEGFQRFPGRA